jgi:hypothetical protein
MRFKQFMQESIKIGGKKLPDNSQAMLDEYFEGTSPHPFDRSLRIWNDVVGISLVFFDGAFDLQTIMTFSDKNQGDASKALKWLTSLADKHKCVLTLEVVPLKAGSDTGKNLTKKDLIAWYKRNGFKKDMGDVYRREPQ